MASQRGPTALLKVRTRPATREQWERLLAYGRYVDGLTADRVLARIVADGITRYRRKCVARGIPPDYPLSGLKRAPKPMPDLRKPGPVVD